MARGQKTPKLNFQHLSRTYLPSLTNYQWAKYLLMFWSMRMAIFAVSLIFPILASLSAPQESDIYQFNVTYIPFSSNIDLSKLMSLRIPFVVTNFSHPNGQIDELLDFELPRVLSNVKVSHSPEFIHFSSDQMWATRLNTSRTHSILNMDTSEFLAHRSNPRDEIFVYLSRQIRDPLSNILIQNLSPNFRYIPTFQGLLPDVRLWMSSKGVIASPHYDMEHNFFLQVNGTKKFLISSPIHYEVFQPHSFLHPCWRQSQFHSQLLTIQDIISSPHFLEEKRKKKKSVYSLQSNSTECLNHELGRKDVSYQSLWSSVQEVTLVAGQLLYIPPFFYHSVIAVDQYSVSLNSWIGSEYFLASEKLRQHVPLPFYDKNSIVLKLSAIGALIKLSLVRLSLPFSIQDFKMNMQSRIRDIQFDEERYTTSEGINCSSVLPEHCTEETRLTAGNSNKVRQSAEKIYAQINNFAPSIQRVLLLDYFEDILGMITPNIDHSPKILLCVINMCLV